MRHSGYIYSFATFLESLDNFIASDISEYFLPIGKVLNFFIFSNIRNMFLYFQPISKIPNEFWKEVTKFSHEKAIVANGTTCAPC